MKPEPLKKVLESLLEAKASMHDVANTSAVEKLDEVINLVQRGIADGNTDSEFYTKVLFAVGKAFDQLPSIIALLKMFSD